MVFSSWRKLVESPRSLPPISYQLLKNLASKSSKPSIMQVWLQHTWCQSSPRNHTMLIKDGAWWAQKASKVDQLKNKQNLHFFFRNNRKSLQIDTKRNDMLNLKRFQSATSRQPGCYATNIRIYGWILWNLNLPGSRLNPLFFCWTNPRWIQRPFFVCF